MIAKWLGRRVPSRAAAAFWWALMALYALSAVAGLVQVVRDHDGKAFGFVLWVVVAAPLLWRETRHAPEMRDMLLRRS